MNDVLIRAEQSRAKPGQSQSPPQLDLTPSLDISSPHVDHRTDMANAMTDAVTNTMTDAVTNTMTNTITILVQLIACSV